jgi:hypothetical protein
MIPVGRKNIAYSLANFITFGANDDLYNVPKVDSVLSVNASQTSNITDNIVGINAIPITNRVVGCYAQPILVNPPTNVTSNITKDGVVLTWIDAVGNTSGYEKVYIFWETTSAESSFVTEKKIVNGGIQTYTIPYSDLTGSNLWYVRMEHGA